MSQAGILTDADRLGLLIKETQAVLHQRMDEVLRPLGLTVPQYACLQALRAEPGISTSELARRTFVSRQSANVLVQGLERRGLVERTGPGSQRRIAVTVTPDAEETLAGAYEAVSGVVTTMAEGLEPDEVRGAVALLIRCRDTLARP